MAIEHAHVTWVEKGKPIQSDEKALRCALRLRLLLDFRGGQAGETVSDSDGSDTEGDAADDVLYTQDGPPRTEAEKVFLMYQLLAECDIDDCMEACREVCHFAIFELHGYSLYMPGRV